MASELRLTTIANNAGTESVDTTYVVNGTVKMWVDASHGHTAQDSFNLSSITDDGSAINTYYYTNNFNNSHYGMGIGLGAGGGNNGADSRVKALTSSSIQVQTTYNDSTLYQWPIYKMMLIGDLA
jgi:hypothetical protein